jgi:hypothetical protein
MRSSNACQYTLQGITRFQHSPDSYRPCPFGLLTLFALMTKVKDNSHAFTKKLTFHGTSQIVVLRWHAISNYRVSLFCAIN